MNARLTLLMLSVFLTLPPCTAQSPNYSWEQRQPQQRPQTVNQNTRKTPPAPATRLQPQSGRPYLRNGLPPVCTDSFVYQAGPMADLIYGDEVVHGPPPYDNFTAEHRIEAGISGTRAAGLTTGHSSLLPTTWGGDEFYLPEPLTMHGWQLAGPPQPAAPIAAPLSSVDQTTAAPRLQIDYQPPPFP